VNTNQYIGLIILAFWAFGPGALAQDPGNAIVNPDTEAAETEALDVEMTEPAMTDPEMTADEEITDPEAEASEPEMTDPEAEASEPEMTGPEITAKAEASIQEPYNPLAPAKAAFYSGVLPGLGQAYNKKYWKIPIVYGGIAAGVYFYQRNTEDYNRFRDAYKRRLAGYQDDEFQGVSDARLRDAQKTAGRNRDVSLAMAIGVYLLNILDANVDAHLLRYNLNEDLSLRPSVYYQPDSRPSTYGLSLNISLP
jgi:hypothetical protein